MRFRLGEGRRGGGMKREEVGWQEGRWDPEERLGNWGVVVVVQSSKVQISGTPRLLLFDLHSQWPRREQPCGNLREKRDHQNKAVERKTHFNHNNTTGFWESGIRVESYSKPMLCEWVSVGPTLKTHLITIMTFFCSKEACSCVLARRNFVCIGQPVTGLCLMIGCGYAQVAICYQKLNWPQLFLVALCCRIQRLQVGAAAAAFHRHCMLARHWLVCFQGNPWTSSSLVPTVSVCCLCCLDCSKHRAVQFNWATHLNVMSMFELTRADVPFLVTGLRI